MKIGVLTMHRVKNHGSFLQAYALCNLIREISGQDAFLVDFSTENGIIDPCKQSYMTFKSSPVRYAVIKSAVALTSIPLLKGLLLKNKKINGWRNLFKYYRLYNEGYEKCFWSRLPLLNKTLKDADIDLLIIGSDEVFNYKVNNAVGYSDELFGAGSPTEKIISFSACFGNTEIDDIDSETKEKLAGYLSIFSGISVRDKNSEKIVKYLLGEQTEVEYHLDPVFHYSFEKELPKVKRKKPYLALYAYDGLEEEYKTRIKEYANSMGLDIVCLHGYQGDFGEYIDASPFEVLSYIKGAKCVVTTTFHGSVFSIKYNKPFCAFIRRNKETYNNQGKLQDLLCRLGLQEQIIDDFYQIGDKLEHSINYDSVNRYISLSVSNSKKYLEKFVGANK